MNGFEEGGRGESTAGSGSSTSFASAGTVAVGSAAGDGSAWCLPNAAQQNFSGVIVKENNAGVMPQGKWEGQHW